MYFVGTRQKDLANLSRDTIMEIIVGNKLNVSQIKTKIKQANIIGSKVLKYTIQAFFYLEEIQEEIKR